MIHIKKGTEPREWTERKATPGFKYEATPELRNALLHEQGYICAYCMRRIPTPVNDLKANETSKIEHIQSRKNRPDLQLDYSNMAICCPGNLNNESHCDTAKKDSNLCFPLYNIELQESIYYSLKDGSISSKREDWNNDIQNVLKLNHPLLKKNRNAALNGVIEAMKSLGWNHQTVNRKYNHYQSRNAEGKFNEYCGIVIWYLEKKIRQL